MGTTTDRGTAQYHTSLGQDVVPRDARSWVLPERSPPAPLPAAPRGVAGSPFSPPLVWGSCSSPLERRSQELWKAPGQLWAGAFPLPAPGASFLLAVGASSPLGQGSGSCSAQQRGGSWRARAAARGARARRARVPAWALSAGRRRAAGAAGSRWTAASG